MVERNRNQLCNPSDAPHYQAIIFILSIYYFPFFLKYSANFSTASTAMPGCIFARYTANNTKSTVRAIITPSSEGCRVEFRKQSAQGPPRTLDQAPRPAYRLPVD